MTAASDELLFNITLSKETHANVVRALADVCQIRAQRTVEQGQFGEASGRECLGFLRELAVYDSLKAHDSARQFVKLAGPRSILGGQMKPFIASLEITPVPETLNFPISEASHGRLVEALAEVCQKHAASAMSQGQFGQYSARDCAEFIGELAVFDPLQAYDSIQNFARWAGAKSILRAEMEPLMTARGTTPTQQLRDLILVRKPGDDTPPPCTFIG